MIESCMPERNDWLHAFLHLQKPILIQDNA